MFTSLFLLSLLTLVELNCENLFDYKHDSLKNDVEYLPDAPRRWNAYKYWQKINNISKCILACKEGIDGSAVPDVVALCEVENDSVMRDLTRRSLLRNAGYEYVMTNSNDIRGIDVALMYQPLAFEMLNYRALRIDDVGSHGPMRDILYVCGRVSPRDTLHIFVVHAPSRYGGEKASRQYRLSVAAKAGEGIDSVRRVSPDAKIIVLGDFNAYSGNKSMERYASFGLTDVTAGVKGRNGAKATYKYKGQWESLDHILVSRSFETAFVEAHIGDAPFLIEGDDVYGGVKPRRTYVGYKHVRTGTSDHLPLVATFMIVDD